MPIETVPAIARIKEARLRVVAPSADVTRPLNRKTPFAAMFREMWAGEILFTELTRLQAQELTAWFELLDGRTTPFFVPLKAGKFSQVCTANVTLAEGSLAGSDRVRLRVSDAPLLRGTLLAIGDPETRRFQVVEVLQTVQPTGVVLSHFDDETEYEESEYSDALPGDPQDVYIAPRLRYAFTADAPLVVGTVNAKYTLASDELESAVVLSHGVLTVNVLESLNA